MNDRATPTPSPPPRKPSRGRYQPLHSIRVVERQEETPVFEIDEEERLEEMATVGRGPRRLAAAARLAAKTRRAVRQTRRAALDPLPAAQPDSGSQSAPIAKSRAAKPPAAKGVMDCRFLKEEDERLNCFNGFAESIPKFR